MDQIIQTFGIDARLITIQIINFTLLLGLLWYFLYKPVLGMLQAREDKIKQGIADAESAAASKAEADSERKAVVSEAHKEAGEVAARAKQAADAKGGEILSAAEEKAAGVIRSAEQKGTDIQAQARKDSEAEIAKLAVLAAEKLLKKEA